jgi:hypothetical protein
MLSRAQWTASSRMIAPKKASLILHQQLEAIHASATHLLAP